MLVTATRIAQWADTREAQASLPGLVRRLVCRNGTVTQIAIPCGDSVNAPGWDGEVACESGSPWVPKGRSYWECSVDKQPTRKANKDFNKRTARTPQEVRATGSLLVVTARKWRTKKKWLEKKLAAGDWANVRAYDADDLEHWLEECPGVAIQFAEELGLIGPGVESVAQHWVTWSRQSDPPVSAEAVFADREAARRGFLSDMRSRIQSDDGTPYLVRSDSAEEAAAFVCAAVVGEPDLAADSLVVTGKDGWRFVEANQAIRVAVAADPEVAKTPVLRKGTVTVIPFATGNVTTGARPAADLTLPRPHIHEYEKAIVGIGLDEAEARRLAATTGRSWGVFRRLRTTNPAIRNPAWLADPQSEALAAVCLVGTWSADSAEDRGIVARIAGRNYEDVERSLQRLAALDDAPVLKLGAVWKAKSPLEFLDLFGGRITRNEFDRFLDVMREILLAPDPALDLPDNNRWAAGLRKVSSAIGTSHQDPL